ncbi:MAG: C-terminal binding protein, partial [Chloroflexota bacterium]|nr:C-terminal binding protein [Chloroflexota bacterium]
MARFTAVHTDPPPGNTLAEERAQLERAEAELIAAPPADRPALKSLLARADAVLNTVLPVDAGLISILERCRAIVRTGVGVDNLDVAAATARGIVVACVPDASVEEVSNHALGLLLACSRKIVRLDRALRSGAWDRTALAPMGTIHGQTLGLVGFGRIARALAAKVKALGMRVVACDPYVAAEVVRAAGVEALELAALLEQADFVSLHVPLAPETHHLIGAEQLARMRSSAFIINTARGGLIDQPALVAALNAKAIAGAGLDVYEHEPLEPTDPL